MKKFITITTAIIVSLISASAYAMEADITSYIADNNQWIDISGIADKEYQNIAVKVLKPGKEDSEDIKDSVMITTVSSDGSKEFSKQFRVPSDVDEGIYIFKFKDSDGNELRKEYSITSLDVTLEKFNIICTSKNVLDIKSAIETHSNVLGMEKDEYSALTDSQKSEAVSLFIINRDALQKEEFSVGEISELLKEASVVEKIKSSEGTASAVMTSYEELLELKKSRIYAEYVKNIDDNMFSKICERTVKQSAYYSSYESLKQTYDLQILLEIIQSGGSWYITQDIVNNNYEELGLTSTDISKISALNQPSLLYQYLTGTAAYTQEDFRRLFNSAYSDALKNGNAGSGNNYTGGSAGGSSGGGSHSSGGGNYMPPADVKTNTVNEEKEEAVHSFDDIKENTPWAEEAVKELSYRGIVNGKSEGVFAPNDSVTREEFAKMLVLAVGYSISDVTETEFEDVDKTMWYAPFVETARENGIITGISDIQFGIGVNITRQDMAVMIYRAMGSVKPAGQISFNDSDDISDYAYEAVAYMSEKGIISGQSNNLFAPKSFATRAEAAVMLYNTIKFMNI